MKKALSLILSLVMVLTLIPMSALPAFAEGETTVSEKPVVNVYNDTVPTDDSTGVLFTDLFGEENKLQENTVYRLYEDIDLAGTGKEKGGEKANRIIFQNGTVLDGNGKSITGIALEGSANIALFWVETENITVEVKSISFGTENAPMDFKPTGTSGKGVSLFDMTSGSAKLTLSNVKAYVKISPNGGGWQEYSVFVARNWGTTTFNNCVTYGTIDKANGWVGSFVGYAKGGKVIFNNCVNNISYTNMQTQAVGGFVGYSVGNTAIEFNNCVNNGDFTGVARQVGGFVGNFESSNNTLSFVDCVNNGNIDGAPSDGSNHVFGRGGFVGTVGVGNNAGKVSIEDCINKGNIKSEERGHAGGAVGHAYNTSGAITVRNFYNAGDVYSFSSAGGVVGISEPSADNSAFIIDVDNAIITGDVSGRWRGCAITGYAKAATITIDNCIATGNMIQNSNNTTSHAFTEDNNTGSITGSGNYAVKGTTASKTGLTENLGASLETILEMVNTYDHGFGRFTANSAGDNIVLFTPQYQGYQMGKIDENGKYTVRFLATINDVKLADPCEYTVLGMEFGRMVDGEFERVMYKNVACVYMSVIANENGVQRAYTAEELGGSYIYAVIGEGFDASKDLNMAIRTYAEDADGVRYYGETYSITIPAQVK